MSNSQGKHLAFSELATISLLLRDSDLTLAEIATRMNRSHSAIISLNRRVQIRDYGGMRSQWVVNPDSAQSVTPEIALSKTADTQDRAGDIRSNG